MHACRGLRPLLVVTFLLTETSSGLHADSSAEGLRIVAFGDSTTFGYGVDESYPMKLVMRLLQGGRVATVINAGFNGDTTAGARNRFARDVLARDPDIVIVQFGLNDQTIRLYQRPEEITPYVTQADFAAHLRHFAEKLRKLDKRIVFMTPNPMCWTSTLEKHYPEGPYLDHPDGGNALLERYAECIRQISREQNAKLIDVYAAFQAYADESNRSLQDLYLEDGVHPNERGYDLIVDEIVRQLFPDRHSRTTATQPRRPIVHQVIHEGTPHSAYIVGWGCRLGKGFLELEKTEHERNPREQVIAPLSLEGHDWSLSFTMTPAGQSRCRASIELEESRVTLEAPEGVIRLSGPLFGPSDKTIPALEQPVLLNAPLRLGLDRKGQHIEVQLNDRVIHRAPLRDVEVRQVAITQEEGKLRLREFRVRDE